MHLGKRVLAGYLPVLNRLLPGSSREAYKGRGLYMLEVSR